MNLGYIVLMFIGIVFFNLILLIFVSKNEKYTIVLSNDFVKPYHIENENIYYYIIKYEPTSIYFIEKYPFGILIPFTPFFRFIDYIPLYYRHFIGNIVEVRKFIANNHSMKDYYETALSNKTHIEKEKEKEQELIKNYNK